MPEATAPHDPDSSRADVRRQLRILVLLDVLLAIAAGYLTPWDPSLFAIFFPLFLLSLPYWVALFALERGARWARTIVLVGSCLGLFGFLEALRAGISPVGAMNAAAGVLSVYQLVVLNQRRTEEFFGVGTQVAQPGTRPMPLWLKVLLGFVGGLIGLVVVGLVMVFAFMSVFSHQQIWVEDIASGRATPLTHEGVNDWPCVSPNGRHLVYEHADRLMTREGEIRICSFPEGRIEATLAVGSAVSSPCWDPTGTKIAFCTRRADDVSEVRVWSPTAGSNEEVWLDFDRIYQCTWSPDGRWLALLTSESGLRRQVVLLTAEGREPRSVGDAEYAEARSPCWSPGGSTLAFSVGGTELVLYNADSSQTEPRVIEVRGMSNVAPAYFLLDDTSKVVVAGFVGTSPRLAALSLATGEVTLQPGNRRFGEKHYGLSPDGQRMVYTRPGRGPR